jgi:hypothetical protein
MDINVTVSIDFSERAMTFLAGLFSGTASAKQDSDVKQKVVKEKPVKDLSSIANSKEESTNNSVVENSAPKKTLDDLKKIGTARANRDEDTMKALKGILDKYGVPRVSAILPGDYNAAYAEIEAL